MSLDKWNNIDPKILDSIRWEIYPKQPTGGQTTGRVSMGVTLICEPLNFTVSVNSSKSMMDNKEFCMELFYQFFELTNHKNL